MSDQYTADEHVEGEFDTPINCPNCGSIMSTDYDPAGLPAVRCTNPGCERDILGDAWLRNTGNWTED